MFQECLTSDSKKFQKALSASFKEDFKRVQVFQRRFKDYLECFKVVLFLKVSCCMSLITASLAEGGLVRKEIVTTRYINIFSATFRFLRIHKIIHVRYV